MRRLVLCASAMLALWWPSVLSLAVFSDPRQAHMLLRTRRANGFMEELRPPSKERECVEEKCDFEEAREIFKTREATLEFWTVYVDGDQCLNNSCVHGECKDTYQNYTCVCQRGYEGRYCDQPLTGNSCSVDNGGCDHNCAQNQDTLGKSCSCVKGYRLDADGKKCVPTGSSSCGQLMISRSSYTKARDGLLPWILGGEVGKKGESPWQALLLNAIGKFHCGGVLIDAGWVLTAAHCLDGSIKFKVRLGDYERYRWENSEVTVNVAKIIKHPNYNRRTVDNDIALLRLEHPVSITQYIVPVCLPGRQMAERVLHLNGTAMVVTGWGRNASNNYSSALNVIRIPLVERTVCAQHMTNNITDNVLCAGILGQRIDACEGDSGGPMVTLYRDTWFLIGLVSWGEGCGKLDKFGIYTKVSNYNGWISNTMDQWKRRQPPKQRVHGEEGNPAPSRFP